jgi:CheY-like chemotaxis protein
LRRILDNSIKFTATGGIELSVKSASPGGSAWALITFEVRDTGPGFTSDILAELDSPADSPRTGLGLSIVQARLSDLKGELRIPSSSSDGTMVQVCLPLKVAACASPAEHSGNPGDRTRTEAIPPLRLLVVEDSDDSFNLFQVYVKGQGHTVSRAFNGSEAVEMVKNNDYDLIMMDIDMPVMNGYAATRTIREWETLERRIRIPIVLLSAESASSQRRLGASAGCSGYLTKPVPKEVVLKALYYFSSRLELPV